jgi:hypothetical protein
MKLQMWSFIHSDRTGSHNGSRQCEGVEVTTGEVSRYCSYLFLPSLVIPGEQKEAGNWILANTMEQVQIWHIGY